MTKAQTRKVIIFNPYGKHTGTPYITYQLRFLDWTGIEYCFATSMKLPADDDCYLINEQFTYRRYL